MNILLIDDEPLARNELHYLLHSYNAQLVIDEADSIESALAMLLAKTYAVVFLDIHLTDESGLTLASMINKMADPPAIIFATAYDQYAIEAFEKNARDYLLKPYDEKRLAQAMDKICGEKQQQISQLHTTYASTYPIEQDDRIYMVQAQSLIVLEASQGETVLYTDQASYHSHETLAYWQDKLDPTAFMRVHRSYIVRLDKIKTIEPWFNQTLQLKLEQDLKAPVSRSNVKELKEKLGI